MDAETFKQALVRMAEETRSVHAARAVGDLRQRGFAVVDDTFARWPALAGEKARGLLRLGRIVQQDAMPDSPDRVLDWVLDAPFLLDARLRPLAALKN